MGVITGRIVGASGPTALPVPTVGQVVENVTALRALAGSADLPAIALRQYASAGPNLGGGTFVWDAAAAVDDGVLRFNAGGPSSSGEGWQRIGDLASVDVTWSGVVGDGAVDDTLAFQRALDAAAAAGIGVVRVPAGLTVRITSTITISSALTVRGDSSASGGIADSAASPFATLHHDFDGDFFVFDGDAGNNPASGGGLERLRLAQVYQVGAAPRGRAIYVYAQSAVKKPSWLFFRDLIIEESDALNPWTWNLYFDGTAANTGLWDMRLENINAHCDGGSGGLYVASGANFQAVNCDFFLDGNITITGTAGFPSANTRLLNVNGSALTLDYVNGITVVGGTHDAATVSGNAIGTNVILPARIATGGEAAYSDASGLVGRLIYRPLLDGTAGASAWYSANNFALPNSRWFMGLNTAGDTVPMLGVDVNNRVRLVPYQDASVIIGSPLNLSGVGNSDLALENAKGVWFANGAGTNTYRVLTANSSDQIELGSATEPVKYHDGWAWVGCSGSLTPGSKTYASSQWHIQYCRLQLTGTQRLTLSGDARYIITDL